MTPTIIAGIIILIVGIAVLIYGLYKHNKASRITSWPRAEITVLTALAKPANAAAGSKFLKANQLPNDVDSSARYEPVVSYQYTVDNKRYTSNSFAYNQCSSYTSQEMKTYLAPLTGTTAFSAFYDPGQPSESYLFVEEVSWTYAIVGLLIGIVGAIVIAVGVKSTHKGPTIEDRLKDYKNRAVQYYDNVMSDTDYDSRTAVMAGGGMQ